MGRFIDVERPSVVTLAVDEGARPVARGETQAPIDTRSDTAKAAERIAALIPAEIVAGYSVLMPGCVALGAGDGGNWIAWVVFFALWISTPIYLVVVQHATMSETPQVVIATVAFVGWAYSLGSPFAMQPLDKCYNQQAGMLITGLFSVLVGIFYKPKK